MNDRPDPALSAPVPAGRSAPPEVAGLRRAMLPSLVGIAAAVTGVAVLRFSGSLRQIVDALVVMGFDLDRAILITALIAGVIAAMIVAACAGRPSIAVLACIGATAAVFGAKFVRETRLAMASTGANGVFDPVGWIGSVVTLAVAATVLGWASAMLTGIVRRFLVSAMDETRVTARARSVRAARLVRPMTVVAVLVLLVATVPIFGDMVNFTPDAHMRTGSVPGSGPVVSPVAGGGPISGAGSSAGSGIPASGSASPTEPPASASSTDPRTGMVPLPTDLAAGPLPGSLITPGVIATGRPWASSAPSGSGQITGIDLPAPWTGGTRTMIRAEVYLPPGYATSRVRYPVLYEAPLPLSSWTNGAGIISMLDDLIDTGAIPPMIAVFNSEQGGPYRDAECANTYDGREQFDTYMSTKLVQVIDSRYRTIPTPAARALIGDSLGGYCSVALWSHHPDVFGSAVSFSGYFVSGIRAIQTLNAASPFGHNAAYEASQSPMNIVPRLPASLTSSAFVVMSADLNNTFFGMQIREFSHVLDAAKVPMTIFPARYGHSWQTPREQLPSVLELLSGRMLKLGVFGAR